MARRGWRKRSKDAANQAVSEFFNQKPKQKRDTSLADAIKARIARYYIAKMRKCFFEFGLCGGGRLRADVIVFSMGGHIVIIEVKSSLADFRKDKKMQDYESYCNQSYVALPESVYKKVKDEILPDWGVFIMSEDGQHIRKVKGAKSFDLDTEKIKSLSLRAVFRTADLLAKEQV